jgi:predicted nuclease of predicted toxin-antitoxin system
LRVLLDECMPFPIIARLADLPHQFEHATKLGLAGLPNGTLYHFALVHHDVFITNDRHFRRPDVYPVASTLGIVFVRIAPCTTESVVAPLRSLFTGTVESILIGHRVILRRDWWESVA